MANNNISIQICGRPSSSGGFSTVYIKNSVIIDDKKEDVYDGFGTNSYFFTVKIENSQVVYKLVKNNIFSKNSARCGWLQIAIAVPKGYKLNAGLSPYDVLMELKKVFLERCMTCKDPVTEKYEFSSDRVLPSIMDDIAGTYTLVPVQMPYYPMNANAPIAYVTATEDKIEQMMKDVQYPCFAKFSEIVVAETVQNTSYISIPNITIPRMSEYIVYEDGEQTSVLSDPKQAYTVKGKGDPRFYDNGSLTFTLEELLIGEVIPNVCIDKANEIITINTQSLVQPKTCTVNVVFEPKEAETYFYTKRNEWALLYGNNQIQLSKDLSFTVSGENINILNNPQHFRIMLSRKDQYVITNIIPSLNEIKVYAEKVKRVVNPGVPYGGGQPQESLINACEVQLFVDSAYVRSDQCSFLFYDSEERLLQKTIAFFTRVQGGNVLAKAYIPKHWATNVHLRVKLANDYFNFGRLPKDKNGVIDLRDMECTRKSIGFFSKYSKLITIITLIFISLIVGGVVGAYLGKILFSKEQVELNNHVEEGLSDGLPFNNSHIKTLVCPDCNDGPFDENELATHHLTCPKRVPCDLCSQKFASESELCEHKSEAHEERSHDQFTCSNCGQVCSTQQELKTHNRRKHDNLTCNYCSESFVGSIALDSHIKAKHNFVCDECPGKSFTDEAGLTAHKRGLTTAGKRHNNR